MEKYKQECPQTNFMKQTTDKAKAKILSANLPFARNFTKEAATKEFVAKLGKAKDDSCNNYASKFLSVMETAMAQKGSFCLSDILYFAKPYGIPATETARLLELWATTFASLGKCSIVDGCYSEKIVILT